MSSRLIRWSGLALLLAGLLLGIAIILHPDEANPNAVLEVAWAPVHQVMIVGALLSLFGLIGFYVRQRGQAGVLGLIGFLLLFVGSALFVPIVFAEAFIIPVIAADPAGQALLDPAGPLFGATLGLVFLGIGVIFGLGCIVSGIATFRAGALPRLAGPLLVAGGPLLAFTPPLPHIAGLIGGVALGLAYVWLGYTIWAGAPERTMRTSAVSEQIV